jgi:uncharacterized MAPEG superfamily protein
MPVDKLIVVVTLLALMTYAWICARVGRARMSSGLAAPAVTGNEAFERAYRVQMNTLEWLPLFLPSLWLFAYLWNAPLAAALGLVWIGARILYAISYVKDPASRGPGFLIQAIATSVLLLGALGKAIWQAAGLGG